MLKQCVFLAVLLTAPLTAMAQDPAKLAEDARAAERRGDLAKAIELQERALALLREQYPADKFPHGQVDLARCHQDLGLHYFLRGEPVKALPHFREALRMRRNLYPPAQFPDGNFRIALTLQHLGTTLHALGRANESVAPLQEAVAMCRKIYPESKYPDGHLQLAGAIGDLAMVLAGVGQVDQALARHEETVAMNRRLYPRAKFPDGHPRLADSLNNLGVLLQSQGQTERALPYFREALAMYQKAFPAPQFPAGHPRIAAVLNNLGALNFSLRKPEQALQYWHQYLDMNRKSYPVRTHPNGHPDLAQGFNNLGKVLYVIGKPAEALPHLEDALAMRQRLHPAKGADVGHTDVTQNLHDLGLMQFALGRSETAIASLQDALSRQHQQFARLAEAAAEAEALQLVDGMQTTTNLLLSATTDPQAAAATYAALWPGRSTLSRLVERRHVALRAAGADLKPDWDRLTETRRELTRVLFSSTRNADFDRQVRALTERKEELERSLAARLPVLAEQQRLDRLGPADLQGSLPAGSVFIDLLRFTRFDFDLDRPGYPGLRESLSYVGFVIARDRIKRVELGDAGPIETALDEWRTAIAAGKSSQVAATLRRLLWEPIAKALPADAMTLYVAADNRLPFLPWPALPGDKADSVLLEKFAFAQVPHGRLLLAQLRQPAPAEADTPILAVGAVTYSSQQKPRPQWEDLPGTKRELDVLRRLRPQGTTTLEGANAGTDRLLAELPKARVVHLATHGYFELDAYRAEEKRREEQWRGRPFATSAPAAGARNPLSFAGLVLAGTDSPDGGILSAETLIGLPLERTRLAVLSACQTGLGVVADGQCVQSLQRALHVAGCRDVIASLWKVDDDATAALMALFYDKLLGERKSPLLALREAQLTLYRNPHLIVPLAQKTELAGRLRGSPFDKTVTLPRTPTTAEATARSPVRSWAGFVLGGSGTFKK